jgi:hypothetical protein
MVDGVLEQNVSRNAVELSIPRFAFTLLAAEMNVSLTKTRQTYTNTTITLSAADPTFSNTLAVGSGIVHSALITPDGGKTWTVASIQIIPPYTAP